ncbi:DUF664 domain-containing protein [Saccharopolyspora taberi]|uniref:DUF664 domain-containing protein n=1 Tax=Saccharopolyspora taberi TaxID=60895 RepID=A0ABN3VAT2_9PSEU
MPQTHRRDPGPPKTGPGEKQVLLGFLDYLRDSVIAKTHGVPEPQVRTPGVASGTNLLGLVKHLTHVERYWLLGHPIADWDATFRPAPEGVRGRRCRSRPGLRRRGVPRRGHRNRTRRAAAPSSSGLPFVAMHVECVAGDVSAASRATAAVSWRRRWPQSRETTGVSTHGCDRYPAPVRIPRSHPFRPARRHPPNPTMHRHLANAGEPMTHLSITTCGDHHICSGETPTRIGGVEESVEPGGAEDAGGGRR